MGKKHNVDGKHLGVQKKTVTVTAMGFSITFHQYPTFNDVFIVIENWENNESILKNNETN